MSISSISSRARTTTVLVGALVAGSLGATKVGASGTGASQSVPELPEILSARVVLGTKYGTAVRVSYCFRSMPSDPSKQPARLHLTVDNLRDSFPPLSVGWTVTTRCNTVIHPVGGIQQPYVLRYFVESQGGTRSGDGQIRLTPRPELARRPELPHSVTARVVAGADGRALRISYCFRSLPRDLSRRPRTLWITIVNARTDLREASALGKTAGGPSTVTRRCDAVTYPVPRIAPRYRIIYSVVSKHGTRSGRGQVVVG